MEYFKVKSLLPALYIWATTITTPNAPFTDAAAAAVVVPKQDNKIRIVPHRYDTFNGGETNGGINLWDEKYQKNGIAVATQNYQWLGAGGGGDLTDGHKELAKSGNENPAPYVGWNKKRGFRPDIDFFFHGTVSVNEVRISIDHPIDEDGGICRRPLRAIIGGTQYPFPERDGSNVFKPPPQEKNGPYEAVITLDPPVNDDQIRLSLISQCDWILVSEVEFYTVDSDYDGVYDGIDDCPVATVPDASCDNVGIGRFCWDGDSFVTRDDKNGDIEAVVGGYTIELTRGCSCDQIVDKMGNCSDCKEKGCTAEELNEWIATKNLNGLEGVTINPTSLPSYSPSKDISSVPSISTSEKPSSTMSHIPTNTPSALSSGKPSPSPSRVPSISTEKPTSHPSTYPSQTPTKPPSNVRSSEPTSMKIQSTTSPSQHISSPPSNGVSNKPSLIIPSDPPTLRHTTITTSPSLSLDDVTRNPTSLPSYFPSKYSSSVPSIFASEQPSTTMTHRPTNTPSNLRSGKPSPTPSRLPSISTKKPTSHISNVPSQKPTNIPSNTASNKPSLIILSNSPSTPPSSNPTDTPSKASSSITPTILTLMPTLYPTNAPTIEPVSSPFPTAGDDDDDDDGGATPSLPCVIYCGDAPFPWKEKCKWVWSCAGCDECS
eukprot:CAMPEP_0172483770 /NCGR_PEP_ID=MMETSP1066-20121228/10905_1 /TAXON_ID=671091 /ORGANISM="Coscinodiscus wailesii, Strain CCMP2513" /LENGTH=657 /DNA_ID=CAMNT_0013247849 /DNA_START=109 /DNA_END=2082 /DNA_ORIENTATION=+